MQDRQIVQSFPTVRNLLNIPVWLTLSLVAADTAVFIIAKYLSFYAYFILRAYIIPNPEYDIHAYAPHPTLHLVLGGLVITVLWGRGLYTNRIPWWSQARTLAHITLFAFIVHGFLSFSLKVYDSRLFIIFYWILIFHGLLLFKAVIFKLAQRSKQWKVPTVIVSDVATAEDLLFAFSSDISTGYKVHTILIRRNSDGERGFDLSGTSAAFNDVRICYGVEGMEDYISENPDNYYIVSLDAFRDRARETILKLFNETNTPYSIVPSLSRANFYQMEPTYFFGHDVVMLHTRSSAAIEVLDFSLSKLVKRAMDIGASGGALLFAGPVILILGALLKLEGQGGSIFYGGQRIGKDGKLFNCWKLRSMEPNSDHLLTQYLDANPQLKEDWEKFRKLPRDPRVTTRTARMIRKLSLDELPQLWNIFVGDMSLVGPRPILPDEVHYFDENTMADYVSVRPGLTGLWQVSGRNKTSFKRRVYWDSWYVRNWSLWGDLIILIKTPIVLITRKGAS